MTKIIEKIIFIIALIIAIISFFYSSNLVIILLFGFSLLYFGFGWYLLNPDETKGFGLIAFFASYAYSSALLSLAFRAKEYPLTITLQYVSIAFLIAIIILLSLYKKSDTIKGRTEMIVKPVILLIVNFLSMIISI